MNQYVIKCHSVGFIRHPEEFLCWSSAVRSGWLPSQDSLSKLVLFLTRHWGWCCSALLVLNEREWGEGLSSRTSANEGFLRDHKDCSEVLTFHTTNKEAVTWILIGKSKLSYVRCVIYFPCPWKINVEEKKTRLHGLGLLERWNEIWRRKAES